MPVKLCFLKQNTLAHATSICRRMRMAKAWEDFGPICVETLGYFGSASMHTFSTNAHCTGGWTGDGHQ